jgi:glyoxylase-like metal-dependent hydrolase (beta-lactamase superfamily II)
MKQEPELTHYRTSGGADIHRVPVLAFPGMWANVYLIEVDGWVVLVDSGSGNDISNKSLESGLLELGYQPDSLTHILLTHGHIDHYGGLSYIRSRSSAKLGVHELDLGTIARHEQRLAVMTLRLDSFLIQAGLPEERRAELLKMYRFTKGLYSSVSVDFTYEAAGMQVGPFEIIHLPGHCPGHVALKLHDTIFCGDLVLRGLTPHQSPEELTPYMGVRHYLHSLETLRHWGASAQLILNGHGEPELDLGGRITEIRRNLARRIHQTLEALKKRGTIAEATARVYGKIDGYNALLVIEKIGAYVEYLNQSGLLEITNLSELEEGSQQVAIRYQQLRGVDEVEILPKERAYVFV